MSLAPIAIAKTLPPPEVSAAASGPHLLKEEGLYSSLLEIAEIFGANVGELERAYSTILSKAVVPLLRAEPGELADVFQGKLPVFATYTTLLLSNFSLVRIYVRCPEDAPGLLRRVAEFEKELYRSYARALDERSAEAGVSFEGVEYAVAQLFDYDLWILKKIGELGPEGFLELLMERAYEEACSMHGYLLALLYAVTAVNAAIFGLVAEYNEESLEVLVGWAERYARELDAWVDTVNLLVTEECYEALEEYLREKEAR